jgi:hypothetical protein
MLPCLVPNTTSCVWPKIRARGQPQPGSESDTDMHMCTSHCLGTHGWCILSGPTRLATLLEIVFDEYTFSVVPSNAHAPAGAL